ncbi:MAG: hypothetical protein ACQEQF_00635 [Bacillota bacterium]
MKKYKYISKRTTPFRSEFYGSTDLADVRIGNVDNPHVGVSITTEEAKQVAKELNEFFDIEKEEKEEKENDAVAEAEAKILELEEELADAQKQEDETVEFIKEEILFGLEDSQMLKKEQMKEIIEKTDIENENLDNLKASELYKLLLDRITVGV